MLERNFKNEGKRIWIQKEKRMKEEKREEGKKEKEKLWVCAEVRESE